ncbi:methyltransferase family protein [Acidimangrovimonas sediminis]|uniref:methyltransferase family protein n=1 Tax=Acidimangrovimonas sediminis TaxID=2056283 RepID=UPI000C7FCB59|nr:isoprenylcysteine carboxylmethyltransferase family protein [Acidimangrovimonas sediminis]
MHRLDKVLGRHALAVKIGAALGFELLIFAGVLFYGAGTDDWTGGWFFLGLVTISIFPAAYALLRHDPKLIEARLSLAPRGQPLSDRIFVPFHSAMILLWAASAGYDAVRHGWSHVPFDLRAAAALCLPLCVWMGYMTMRQNPFLATTVCLQTDRGHRVVDNGAYAIVRHPFYTVTIACQLSASLLLGSWLSVALTLIIAAMLALRLVHEERFLEENLAGYASYKARTVWRLVPGLW